jgi:hypothetical protein
MKINSLRYPQTMQEKRKTEALLRELEVEPLPIRIRRSRVGHNLPDEREDVSRETLRSWKSYRTTQYR